LAFGPLYFGSLIGCSKCIAGFFFPSDFDFNLFATYFLVCWKILLKTFFFVFGYDLLATIVCFAIPNIFYFDMINTRLCLGSVKEWIEQSYLSPTPPSAWQFCLHFTNNWAFNLENPGHHRINTSSEFLQLWVYIHTPSASLRSALLYFRTYFWGNWSESKSNQLNIFHQRWVWIRAALYLLIF
jgi:hypothetical protein